MTQMFQKQAFYPHFPVSSNLNALSNVLKVLYLCTAGPAGLYALVTSKTSA